MLTSENFKLCHRGCVLWFPALVVSTRRVYFVLVLSGGSFGSPDRKLSLLLAAAGAPPNRRGRGGGHRGRGRFNVRRDGPMKFEKDFDFESANAQFNKEEIDREFQDKLKLKGVFSFNIFYGRWDGNSLVNYMSRKSSGAVLRSDFAPPADKKSEKPEKAVNGEDKGDSGVETQNSEGNADEECDPLGPNCYYDKSKSFFDNISCDDTRSVGSALYADANASHCNFSIFFFPGKQVINLEARLSHGESRPVT